jgi:uncharacterized protein (TIGR01777 family)
MDSLEHTPILVTGGTGFIGSRLVARLLAAGARVTVLTRDRARARRRLGDAVTLVEDVSEVASAAPRMLVNLAGEGIADRPWTEARRRLLFESRVSLNEQLLARLADRPPEVVVSASAVGYYGTSETATFTESDVHGRGFAAELCRDWEGAASRFTALGSRVTCLRIGLVLGPGGLLGRLRLPFSLGLGGRIGHGRQWMSWVHLDDVLGLMEFALRHPEAVGALNATAPQPVTNRDFTRALGAALRRPTLIPAPAFALRAALGDMAEELLLQGSRVLPQRALALGYEFRFPELDDALRAALGTAPQEARVS